MNLQPRRSTRETGSVFDVHAARSAFAPEVARLRMAARHLLSLVRGARFGWTTVPSVALARRWRLSPPLSQPVPNFLGSVVAPRSLYQTTPIGREPSGRLTETLRHLRGQTGQPANARPSSPHRASELIVRSKLSATSSASPSAPNPTASLISSVHEITPYSRPQPPVWSGTEQPVPIGVLFSHATSGTVRSLARVEQYPSTGGFRSNLHVGLKPIPLESRREPWQAKDKSKPIRMPITTVREPVERRSFAPSLRPFSPESSRAEQRGQESQDESRLGSDLYLDGDALGQWVSCYLEEQINRPHRGITAVDPRLTPTWAGPSDGLVTRRLRSNTECRAHLLSTDTV